MVLSINAAVIQPKKKKKKKNSISGLETLAFLMSDRVFPMRSPYRFFARKSEGCEDLPKLVATKFWSDCHVFCFAKTSLDLFRRAINSGIRPTSPLLVLGNAGVVVLFSSRNITRPPSFAP
jgi:hypothetical protein